MSSIREELRELLVKLENVLERLEALEPVTPKRSRKSVPPTVEEVAAYCIDRQNSVNALAFCDFYESKGWVIGKVKMKSWQAAVRTWEKRDNENQQSGRTRSGRVVGAAAPAHGKYDGIEHS